MAAEVPDGQVGRGAGPIGEHVDGLGQEEGAAIGRTEKSERARAVAFPTEPGADGQAERDEDGGAARHRDDPHCGREPRFPVPHEPPEDGLVEPDRPITHDDVLGERPQHPSDGHQGGQ